VLQLTSLRSTFIPGIPLESSHKRLRGKLQDAGFEVLTDVVMKSSAPLLLAGFLLGLFFDPEYVGDIFPRNVG
jgi:hypothetical protein